MISDFQMSHLQWKMLIGSGVFKAYKRLAWGSRQRVCRLFRLWSSIQAEKSTTVRIFIHFFLYNSIFICKNNNKLSFFAPFEKNLFFSLRLHIESKCGTVRCHTCSQCNSKFMTQNTLNAHMQIHIGEKKHLCNYCGNSFLSRGQLKIHERSHTKEKPYKCTVCSKAFAHRESLVTHSSLHTGIKPYQCQCCGNQFSCIGNLIKHRKIRQQTCGLPQYKIMKCAPRASTKGNHFNWITSTVRLFKFHFIPQFRVVWHWKKRLQWNERMQSGKL